MSWQLSPAIEAILSKGADFEPITRDEALALMHLPLHSKETYALMETARQMTHALAGAKGELHFHIGVNVEPCPMDCKFCSLTPAAGIFKESIEFPLETILDWAREGESKGADALNIMTTGTYAFKRLLEVGELLKREVSIPLVANTRDITHREGEQLLGAGFVGCYHAVRLGEGRDTPFKPAKRIRTIQAIRETGLRWMNCIEPVGPEHDPREIVDLMFLARDYGATYSGVMRRINFPGSPMARFGMITEWEMAKLEAVSRVVMGDAPKAHCTHEPNTVGIMAGANLFFPETGSSPRDGSADTAKGRGRGLAACRQIMREMHLDPDLPSNCF